LTPNFLYRLQKYEAGKENFVVLDSVTLTQYRSVTFVQTNRQTNCICENSNNDAILHYQQHGILKAHCQTFLKMGSTPQQQPPFFSGKRSGKKRCTHPRLPLFSPAVGLSPAISSQFTP